MRTFLLATVLAGAAIHGHCADVQKPLAFEVASITPCKPGTPEPPGEHMGMVQFTAPGGRFHASATSIKFLIEWAFGLLPAQHSGGPSWLGTDRYDIVAKAEGNASEAELKRMAQTLLTDRFKLKYHRESKEVPVLIVSLGKGAPKMTPAKTGEPHSIRIEHQMDANQKLTYHVVATRFTISQLNEVFSRQLGRVIVDETGLTGDLDFTMDLTPDENQPNPLDPSLLISAMRDQLGLTLKAEKAPVEFMVIENVEKVVAGNEP
jgi:uncharacterized protein (TIGR03435 family)